MTNPFRLAIILLALPAGLPAADPQPGKPWRNPTDGMEFVWIPPGKFMMGCTPGEKCAERTPLREHTIGEGFWIGRTEVTVGQFRRFVRETGYRTDAEKAGDRRTWRNPGFRQGADHPVVCMSAEDALAYARWAGVDLPIEAEWEYAARAGANTRYSWGERFEPANAWYRENSGGSTRPVAQRRPNAWGLYDVSGNAWEWCRWDALGGTACQPGKPVPRGGSWVSCHPVSLRLSMPTPSMGCFPDVLAWDDDRGFRCIRKLTRVTR